MLAKARHEYLVMATAMPSWVPIPAVVTAPSSTRRWSRHLHLPDVPTGSIWSRLGAMYINEWYVPRCCWPGCSAHERYVSGQTMAAAGHGAPDRRDWPPSPTISRRPSPGELVRRLGLRIVLSPYVVEGEHHEQDYASLARHDPLDAHDSGA